ncbi:hypothetical protein A11A3_07418 [Alcanivorax hongdengensis A-11-3]|uniref:DUF4124 domain-containing protein n=1 Tax=Alcanivorax hongdengensis A-11-3 TaxID=1177179 RepID=L0WFN4_9GAMM|nr:DUF4124 domain-containing protein [Alcanivorax hongdengensis]EKF74630.1 hypothetical protein A11A3_07418 [Alcanivorax hongdengensis A-11-3]
MRLQTVAALTMGLALAASASAEIYRWKDESGHWQYSSRPPAQSQSPSHETVDVTPPAKIGQDENVQQIRERTQRLLDSEQAARDAEKAEAARLAEQKRRRWGKACQQARERVDVMRNGSFEYIMEDGSRRGALPDEVAADIKRTQAWIDQHCDF